MDVFDEASDITRRMWIEVAAVPLIRDCQYLCRIPAALGAVTRLRNLSGRIVAETTSGIPMIVPQRAALV